MRTHSSKLHLAGLAAALVSCGGSDEGYHPPTEPEVIPVAEYNGDWVLTARDTAGCRAGAGFTVAFTILMSDADTSGTGGFAPSGMFYETDPFHAWSSDTLSGPLFGVFTRKVLGQPTVAIHFLKSAEAQPASGPDALFDGTFDRQRTVAGILNDRAPLFSSQRCDYPAVAVKR